MKFETILNAHELAIASRENALSRIQTLGATKNRMATHRKRSRQRDAFRARLIAMYEDERWRKKEAEMISIDFYHRYQQATKPDETCYLGFIDYVPDGFE